MGFDAGTGYIAGNILQPGVGVTDFFQGQFTATIAPAAANANFTMIAATLLNTVLQVQGSCVQTIVAPDSIPNIAIPTLNLFSGPVPLPIIASSIVADGATFRVFLSFKLDVVTVIVNPTGIAYNVNLGFFTSNGAASAVGRDVTGRVTCALSQTS